MLIWCMSNESLSYDQLLEFFVNRGASLDALQDMGGAELRKEYARIREEEAGRGLPVRIATEGDGRAED